MNLSDPSLTNRRPSSDHRKRKTRFVLPAVSVRVKTPSFSVQLPMPM